MSWALVSTAAAGLAAGAGLQAALDHSAAVNAGMVEAQRAVLRATAADGAAARGGLAAASAAAALAAYFTGGENADPAWLTISLLGAAAPSTARSSRSRLRRRRRTPRSRPRRRRSAWPACARTAAARGSGSASP
jgi:hypothetical protein